VNPIKKVVKGPIDNERARYVTQEEAKKLSRFLPECLFGIVIVSCETGLRRCKVVTLLNAQIDFNSGWINIPQKKAREKTARPIKNDLRYQAISRQNPEEVEC
jgi:integrase